MKAGQPVGIGGNTGVAFSNIGILAEFVGTHMHASLKQRVWGELPAVENKGTEAVFFIVKVVRQTAAVAVAGQDGITETVINPFHLLHAEANAPAVFVQCFGELPAEAVAAVIDLIGLGRGQWLVMAQTDVLIELLGNKKSIERQMLPVKAQVTA